MTQSSLFQDQEAPAASPGTCKRVLVPFPVGKAYDYIVPDDMDVQAGDYVTVPLSGRDITGVVWGDATGDVNPKKLKLMIWRYDFAPMPSVQRKFIDWVADYTLAPKGSVLKMSLSAPSALEPPKPIKAYKPKVSAATGLSPQRKKVLEVLSDGLARRPSEIAELAGVSAGVVTGMADKGLLELVEIYSSAPCRKPDLSRPRANLSADQQIAADHLCDQVRAGQYAAALLDGVTGAGKTETYFEAVAEALKAGKQALILLPEIALSNAFLERFKSRFGCAPALWHSHLTPAQRRKTWRGVANGETKVVVGARSALFLPYADLGYIVVDEEHDPAYKQEDGGVIYHARDMAVVRAHLGEIPVTLVSATPSLETMHNAWNGRYDHLHLPDRFGGARLPEIETIDMRTDKPERQHFISPTLKKAVIETVRRGEQVLLFLNRRGYAPLTLCRTCGHRCECPRCTAWLVEHKGGANLQCHHCGFHMRRPLNCPECDDKDSLAACGPGVERIYEEAKSYFPDARIMVLASDTAEDNDTLRAMLDQVREGKVDIIIGTQIVAKGHHFPNLTCVGVIDADLGLTGGELRAAERTYQLLHQVAGRAGRAEKTGHVYLQTFMPDHRIMKALAHGARDAFLEAEAHEREQAHMPPYSRLAGIIIAGREEFEVIEVAKALGKTAPQGPTIQTLGPAPAPLARLRGRYRYRLLVRADKSVNIQKTIEGWIGAHKIPSNVRVYIDIDPQSFL
ncbi:MAG: primosomal protein N' [Alphaproteobacteria bacterium]|nr:primosomal protein N' [Alphaproteobacteria bacterium]